MKHLLYPLSLAALLLCTACDKEPGGEKEPPASSGPSGSVSTFSPIAGTWVADYQEHLTGDGSIQRREVDSQTLTFTAEGTFTATQFGLEVNRGTYRLDGDQLTVTYTAQTGEEGPGFGTVPGDGTADPAPGDDDDDDTFLPGTGGTRATVTRSSVVTVLVLTDDQFAFTETEEDGYVYTIYFHRMTDSDVVSAADLLGEWECTFEMWCEDGTLDEKNYESGEYVFVFMPDGRFFERTNFDKTGVYEDKGQYTFENGQLHLRYEYDDNSGDSPEDFYIVTPGSSGLVLTQAGENPVEEYTVLFLAKKQ